MRTGEVFALTWNDIDFKEKTIKINNKEIKYMIWQYDLSYSSVQKIAAIYILPNNYCYTVTATTYDDDVILDLNTIREFLTIN